MEVAIRQINLLLGLFSHMEREATRTAEVMGAVRDALHMEWHKREE